MARSQYRDRLRILLIIYFFSEDYHDASTPHWVKVFRSEVKIQKIDFLIRYPDYLCFEILELMVGSKFSPEEIKTVVMSIFLDDEPEVRREDMLRYLFGAYEYLSDLYTSKVKETQLVASMKKIITLRITVNSRLKIK
jgi:hypothetical protein